MFIHDTIHNTIFRDMRFKPWLLNVAVRAISDPNFIKIFRAV